MQGPFYASVRQECPDAWHLYNIKVPLKWGRGASSTEEQFSRMKGKMADSLLLFGGFFSGRRMNHFNCCGHHGSVACHPVAGGVVSEL